MFSHINSNKIPSVLNTTKLPKLLHGKLKNSKYTVYWRIKQSQKPSSKIWPEGQNALNKDKIQ